VRFQGYTDEKNSSDGKSIRTAISSKLTTSDKNNSKKRAPICKYLGNVNVLL
jgi:hypothetical protein